MKKDPLSYIYKAHQCTDLNDVNYAIDKLRDLIKSKDFNNDCPREYSRLRSLLKRKEFLLKKNVDKAVEEYADFKNADF